MDLLTIFKENADIVDTSPVQIPDSKSVPDTESKATHIEEHSCRLIEIRQGVDCQLGFLSILWDRAPGSWVCDEVETKCARKIK